MSRLARMLAVALVCATCALAATASSARAVPLHGLTQTACFTAQVVPVSGCTTGQQGLSGANSVAVSPDGTSVYVTGTASFIAHFTRSATGGLTLAGCYADVGTSNLCVKVQGLGGARQLALSPGGDSLYVASLLDDAVVRLGRQANGTLVDQGCVSDTGSATCAVTAQGLNGAFGVAVSPDGGDVYVSSNDDDAVVHLDRAAGGALTPVGCTNDPETATGCGVTAPGLNGGRTIALDDRGASLYVAGVSDSAIATFARAGNGALTFMSCVADPSVSVGCGQAEGLAGVFGIDVSPDGGSLYSGSVSDDAVASFRRRSDGLLVHQGCVSQTATGCTQLPDNALDVARNVAVSPDGESVYAVSNGGSSLVNFDRAPGGALSRADCIGDANSCNPHVGMLGANGVAVSPDNASVYVGSESSNSLTGFSRELPPRCDATASTGAAGVAQSVPLDCADPNGDPVDIEIVSGPSTGTLGAVDQATDSVTYTPAGGFSGADAFSFRARAFDKVSAPAPASVLVAPPQGPVGPQGPQGPGGPQGPQGEPAIKLLTLLALDAPRVKTAKRLKIPFAATAAGAAVVEIRKGSKRLIRLTRKVTGAGRSSVTWNGRAPKPTRKRPGLAPGSYTIALTVTGGDGQVARDSVRLRVTR